SLTAFLLVRGKSDDWKTWEPQAAWVVVAVAAPWFVLCAIVNGWTFLKIFFVTHNVERFTTPIFGHDRPVYFFLPVLLLLTFPCTFLLFSALRWTFNKNVLLLFGWPIFPFFFFSFPKPKLRVYTLPLVPPISLLLAKEILQPRSRVYRVA